MDGTQRPVAEHGVPGRVPAHERAAHLRRRIEALAGDIAVSEDCLARAYEESARLRPHAAERLLEAARRARLYAERERRVCAGEDVPTGQPDALRPRRWNTRLS